MELVALALQFTIVLLYMSYSIHVITIMHSVYGFLVHG